MRGDWKNCFHMVSASPEQTSWPQEAQCVEILGFAFLGSVGCNQLLKGLHTVQGYEIWKKRISVIILASQCHPSRTLVSTHSLMSSFAIGMYVFVQGVSVIPIEVEDSDDEPSDFTDFMVVKEDPYEQFDAENGKPAETKMEPSMKTKRKPLWKRLFLPWPHLWSPKLETVMGYPWWRLMRSALWRKAQSTSPRKPWRNQMSKSSSLPPHLLPKMLTSGSVVSGSLLNERTQEDQNNRASYG